MVMNERVTDRDKIMNLLNKYPQGLTVREMNDRLEMKSIKYIHNQIRDMLSDGRVVTVNDIDHTKTYVHRDHAPHYPKAVEYINNVKFAKYYEGKDIDAHRALLYMEQYPEGISVGDLAKGTGYEKEHKLLYYNMKRVLGSVVELLKDGEDIPYKNRIYRVIGSNDQRTINYYRLGRPICMIYREYEHGNVDITGDKIDPIVYNELVRMINDIEETKSHTPKDIQVKVFFNKDGERVFTLRGDKKGYNTLTNGAYTPYTAEDVIKMLGEYRRD